MHATLGQLKSRFLIGSKNNRGQATVEYILLLVIILALVLGPLKQLSVSFNTYVEALFGKGKFIACLLETGELSGQSSDAASSCLSAFNSSVQTAFNGNGNGNGGGGTGGTNGGNNGQNGGNQDAKNGGAAAGKNAKKAPPNIANNGGAADAGGGAAAGGEGAGGGGAAGGQGRRAPGRKIVNSSGGSGAGKDASEDSFVKIGEQFDYKDLKPKGPFAVNMNGMNRNFKLESEEADRQERLAPKEVAKTNSGALRPKELTVDPSRAPAAKDTDINSDGFGFSMLLKWFLIACIIIAIIIFVGGQAMQISKGGDD